MAQQLVGGFTPGKAWLFAGQLFPGVAGIAPHRFVGVQGLEVAHEGQQLPLIFRLHGFAAQQRKARDIVRLAGCKHFVAGGFIEGLAVIEIPRHGVEAPRAVVAAAGHEHAGAHPRAVGNVIVFDGCVVHNFSGLALSGRFASSLFPLLASPSSPGAGEVCQRESPWRNHTLCMDCQGLPLWGRWHRVSDDGEGKNAFLSTKKVTDAARDP